MCDRHGPGVGERIRALFGETKGLVGAVPAVQAGASGIRRRKLWELEDKLHCPVVGTCLGLDEIARLARRHGFKGQSFDHYRLHVEAVNLSCSRNPVAEAMQKLLDRKFARYLSVFEQARDDAAVAELWRTHLERGEVAGPMWAALTHRAASAETRNRVYADVHMLSHQVGAGQAADLRRLDWLERERVGLQAEKSRLAERLRQQAERIQALERERDRFREQVGRVESLRARVCELESGQAIVALERRLMLAEMQADRARELEARTRAQEERLARLDSELERMRRSLEEVTAERDALERLWLVDAEGAADCDRACERCAGPATGRCVLCVGGRAPLLPQYRQLAERLGVRLIHHDGGREEALSRLPELLAASDAVICPTDCVGHLAYYQLKKHCKQSGKPCLLTRSSGVASIAAALTQLVEGRSAAAGVQTLRDISNHSMQGEPT